MYENLNVLGGKDKEKDYGLRIKQKESQQLKNNIEIARARLSEKKVTEQKLKDYKQRIENFIYERKILVCLTELNNKLKKSYPHLIINQDDELPEFIRTKIKIDVLDAGEPSYDFDGQEFINLTLIKNTQIYFLLCFNEDFSASRIKVYNLTPSLSS